MTPSLPLLEPLPLPAPAWLLSALLALTFTLHALSMNLLLGGSIIAVVSRIRGRRDDRAAALARLIANAMPVVFAATITFGVAALLFLQTLYGRVFFSAAVLLAVPWLLIVPLLVGAYSAAYMTAGAEPDGARAPWRLPLVVGSVTLALLVLVVAFIQANVMSALLSPHLFGPWFAANASGVRLNLGDPTLAPRFLHVVIGAVALAGTAAAVAGFFVGRRDTALSAWMIRQGVLWCAGATTLNLLPGFWWLAMLPSQTMLRFMGRDLVATLWLVGGIVASLAALAHLIPAMMAKQPRSLLMGGAGSLVAGIVCMLMVRDIARRAALDTAGLPPAAWVSPQWGAIAVFGALLVGAIAIVGWMVRALITAPEREATGVAGR